MRIAIPQGIAPDKLAKRIVYLAWKKSVVTGMGILQDRGDQTEEQVWESARGRLDYSGRTPSKEGTIGCDYVNGRMMKLYLEWNDKEMRIMPEQWRTDYQSFYPTYSSPEILFDKAVASFQGG